ncbi:MAG: autotransporter-associated beta strand repeat-containing protein [Thermoguttaceae bacterium]
MRIKLMFLVLALVALCAVAQAASTYFVVTPGNFSDVNNWWAVTYAGNDAVITDDNAADLGLTSPDLPPVASLTIGTIGEYGDLGTSGAMTQFDKTLTVTNNIIIGNTGGSTGTYTMTGGTLNGGSDLLIGNGVGGNGTYNMGNGTLAVTGNIKIGVAGGTGGFNMTATTGTVTSGSLTIAGDSTSTGTLVMSGGTLTANGETQIGNAGGSANFTMTGGTFNFGSWFSVARHWPTTDPVGSSTMDISGGTVNHNAWWIPVDIGERGVGNTGTLKLSGSAVFNVHALVPGGEVGAGGDFRVGAGDAGTGGGLGVLTMAGNAQLNLGWGNSINIGDTGTDGQLTMNGGTLNSGGWSGWFSPLRIGWGQGGGVYSNGTVTVNNGTIIVAGHILVGGLGGTGTVTMTGGTINKTADQGDVVIGASDPWSTSDVGTGTWNQNGGTLLNAARIVIAENENNAGTGTFNLNAGLAQATAVVGAGGNSTFHFNGGTLQATASSNTYMQGLTLADVQGGGAYIDTQNFNIVVAQSLLDGGGGGGGLIKSGLGSLKLNGINTYTGPTDVLEGSLGGSGTLYSGVSLVTPGNLVTVESGAACAPGDPATLTVGNITFDGGSVLDIVLAGASHDALDATGLLTLKSDSGGVTLDVTLSAYPVPGEYDILDWGTKSGDFTTVTLPDLPNETWSMSYDKDTGVLTVVPEPGTIVLLLMGAVMLYLRRWR